MKSASIVMTLLKKEFRQIRRDRRMIPLILVAPVFQLVILGYAATLDVKEVPLAVVDMDRSPASRDLVRRFEATGLFPVTQRGDDYNDADDALRLGRAMLGLLIPRGFGDDLGSGAGTQVSILVDGTQASVASIGLNHAREVLVAFSREHLRMQVSAVPGFNIPGIEVATRVFYNPRTLSSWFMVPAVLAMVLMVMTVVLSSMNIVREKENGTIEQLVVTPIGPGQLIAGKLAPFLVIGLVDVCLILMVAVFWFQVPLRGSLVFLFASTFLFLVSTLGLGLLVSTASSTQQQAMMTSVFMVMVPSVLLSGFIFPIENMPWIFRQVSWVIPMRHYIEIIRGIFLKGTGPAVHWPQLVALGILGPAILASAAANFKKRVD